MKVELLVRGGSNVTVAKRYRYAYDTSGNRISQQIDSAATSERVNGLNQLTNRAATGGIVRIAGYISDTGIVTVAGAPARMTTATNFESEVYAPSLTNTVTIAAADFSGNVATSNRTFTVQSNGTFGSLTYDLNGNLLKKDTRLDISWDEFDRCYYVGYGTTNTRVGHDPLGRWNCLAECTGATTNSVRYFKWEGLRLAEEQNATGTVIRRYFPGGFWFNNANYFYLTDHLGSVRQVADSSGNVVARFEYDPYGRRTQTYGSLQVDIGFTGHFHHGPSGLIFAPLRFYDPETGRWISRDPIQEKGGINLYAYCGGDPVNRADPTGLVSPAEWVEVVGEGIKSLGDSFWAMTDGAVNTLTTAAIYALPTPPSSWDWKPNLFAHVGFYNPCDKDAQLSRDMGGIAFSALTTAAGIPSSGASGASQTVQVTSWAEKGIPPDLNPGRWVVVGGPTKFNFWRTGLPGPKGYFTDQPPFFKIEASKVPFGNFKTDMVPRSSLTWPEGLDKWRGMFGQRKLN